MTSNVVKLSKDNAYTFTLLKKKTDKEILDLYEAACNIVMYYNNTDSFHQSVLENDARLNAYQDKRDIEEYIVRFRPKLKGRI